MVTRCGRCNLTLPDEAFSPANRGLTGRYCRACFKAYNAERWARRTPEERERDLVRRAAWNEAHAEEQAAWHAEYRNRPENKARKRDLRLRRAFGIGTEDYDALLTTQGGVCAICLGPPRGNGRTGNRLHVDHDHATGVVRGLLCGPCNNALGLLAEDHERINRLIRYLKGGGHAVP